MGKRIRDCRRSKVALIGMAALTFLDYTKGFDVSMPIATIVLGVAGSNAWEKNKTEDK